MIEVSKYNNSDRAALEAFQAQVDSLTIFQTPAYFDALRAAKKPVYFFVAKRDGKICGSLLCSTIAQRFDKRAIFSGIGNIMGMPVIEGNDTEALHALLDAAKGIKPRRLFLQMAPVYNPGGIKQFLLDYGFEFRPHLVLQLNLNRSEEEITASFTKEKRKNIRKAERLGLEFKELEQPNKWKVFEDIVKATYARLQIPCPDIDLYKALEEQMPGAVKLFGVYTADKVLTSARLVLCHQKLAYCALMGYHSKYNSMHINELSYYGTILWAKRNGYSLLDMGGGGNPEKPYGVRDFKMGFSPEALNYGHYVLPLRPTLMKIAKWGYRLFYR